MNATQARSRSAPDPLARLQGAVARYQEGCQRIARDFSAAPQGAPPGPAAHDPRWRRESDWRRLFADEWRKIALDVAQMEARLSSLQPALADFNAHHPVAASKTPETLRLGSVEVSFEDFSCLVPRRLPFPVPHALVASSENATLTHQLLLRLLSALPPGQLELTFVDPLKQGWSLRPFLPLLKVEQLAPRQRALTRADEIEAALGELTDYVEDLIQHRFHDGISCWSEYNQRQTEAPLKYRVALLFDAPEQLSDRSLWFLQRLCENGPGCGVLPIVAPGGRAMEDDRRSEKLRPILESSTRRLDALLSEVVVDDMSCAYQPESWPRPDALEAFLSAFAQNCVETTRFSRSMADLRAGRARDATTTDGFDVPIGWTPARDLASLRLGATDSAHHALLAGKTGSGKSNLLHIVIHALCWTYAPEDISLYLLDYKESTEFNVYANPPLPHASLVATESDPEYGLTVLEHLRDEIRSRGEAFKAAGVSDFASYRRAGHGRPPRILLIIDEFQVLFSGERRMAEAAEEHLSHILKQGRSFGVHVLLATQTLKGLNTLSIGSLTSQLGCRIALACGEEDSASILGGSNNWAAAELRSPPEGLINVASGAKSGNVKFLIPRADDEFCHAHLAQLSERAAKSGVAVKTRIFSGVNLPAPPSIGGIRSDVGDMEALVLGEQLTFHADALRIPLTRRSGANLLFCGYNDRIHDGLLTAMLSSMAASADGFEEILYFNGRGVAPNGGFAEVVQTLGGRFRAFDDVAAPPLADLANNVGARRVALIVDGLDSEKALHPSSAYRTPRQGEPTPPAELLKHIVEVGPRKGTFVFAFVDKWQRCQSSCRDLFSSFELRVGYCMNEEDAGAFAGGGAIGKLKGLEKPTRAIFVNRMENDRIWFRPYAQKR